MNWKIEKAGDVLRTVGVADLGAHDVQLQLPAPGLEEAARRLLEVLAEYQCDEGRTLRDGETIQHGYWMLKAKLIGRGIVELWEMTPDAEGFRPGVADTLRYWVDQRAICESVMSVFAPPRPDQLISISNGVLDRPDLLVEGVRYPAPSHASGWYLTTDLYTGHISGMRNEHLYHLSEKRPEIAKYLALPPGWRFEFGDGQGAVYPDEKQQPSAS